MGKRGGLLSALVLASCVPQGNPVDAHLAREVSFLQTGVDVDAEKKAVTRALSSAGLEVVAERSAPGLRALGAARARFQQTAVRVITGRGVVEAEDASRDDVLAPGRVHLLEDVPREIEGSPVVGWVWLEEGTTAGCARLRIIDAKGRPLPVHVQPASLFATGCVGGLERRSQVLWGSVVWPSLTAAATPRLEVPLAPVKGKLDDRRPTSSLALAQLDDWIAEVREERLARLADHAEFGVRHATAVELAALALFAGESRETQRAIYTQHAGTAGRGFERALWAETADLIARGWSAAPPDCDAVEDGTAQDGPCAVAPAAGAEGPADPDPEAAADTPSEPAGADVLQVPVHGQEAQKEDLAR